MPTWPCLATSSSLLEEAHLLLMYLQHQGTHSPPKTIPVLIALSLHFSPSGPFHPLGVGLSAELKQSAAFPHGSGRQSRHLRTCHYSGLESTVLSSLSKGQVLTPWPLLLLQGTVCSLHREEPEAASQVTWGRWGDGRKGMRSSTVLFSGHNAQRGSVPSLICSGPSMQLPVCLTLPPHLTQGPPDRSAQSCVGMQYARGLLFQVLQVHLQSTVGSRTGLQVHLYLCQLLHRKENVLGALGC
jgi:hypothetical protein